MRKPQLALTAITPPAEPLDVLGSFEHYGVALGHTLLFDYKDAAAVLERLGVKPKDWQDALEKWQNVLRQDGLALDKEKAKTLAVVLGDVRKRLLVASPPAAPSNPKPPVATFEAPAAQEAAPPKAAPSDFSVLAASNAALSAPPRILTPEPARPAHAPPPTDDIESTIAGAMPSLRGPLPFVQRSGELTIARPSAEPPPPSRPALDPSNMTLEGGAPSGPSLPFSAGSAAHEAPAIPLEQYGALCAALDVFPERRDFILERYGIAGVEGLRALQGAYRRVFDADSQALAEWQKHRLQYRDKLQGKG